MKKKTERKIRYLKNKSVWPYIISFIVFMLIGGFLVSLLFVVSLSGIIQNKINDSLRDSYKVQEYIDERVADGAEYGEIVSEIENMIEHPMALNVFDENDALIASYGEELAISEAKDSKLVELSGIYFSDSNSNAFLSTQFDFSILKLITNLADGLKVIVDNGDAKEYVYYEIYGFECWLDPEYSSDIESFVATGIEGAAYIFDNEVDIDVDETDLDNVGADVNENGIHIYMKYKPCIYINDVLLLIIIIVVASLIFIVTLIIQLITSIVNITYQHSILKIILRDPVTNGNSMLAFEQFVGKVVRGRQKRGFAIVDMSLMRYQNYCTLYGLEEGEKLIEAIDKLLNKKLGSLEMVAKSSSAGFVLLLTSKHHADCSNELMKRVQDILDKLPDELREYGKKGNYLQGLNNIGLKAGMYVLKPATNKEERIARRERSQNIEQLLMKADIAKQAVSEDGGLVRYNHKMWEEEVWAQKVEDMMQDALEASEFQVYIQPKYNPSTEELMGGEALVRWNSPSEGFISPGRFIPIFEKNGFITKLDDYMISHTAELQAKWYAEGRKIVPISVNVSRLHFSNPDLAEHIKELVDKYTLPHRYIEIELTESAFFDNKNALLDTVRKLQEYDFEVSMDDFGAGYSSLNSLKDLPLNVLKLDAEFFRGEDFDNRGEIVVAEAITLAKQLNMRIVAEGVEKKEQVDFLAKQNCDMIQGYYFAKPMPAAEYEQRMAAGEVTASDEQGTEQD